jgi:hypothetical protein
MEFKLPCIILLFFILMSLNNATIAQIRDSSTTAITIQRQTGDSVSIDGTILDSMTGEFPRNDSFIVKIDSILVIPDSQGAFVTRVPHGQYHSLRVISGHFEPFSQIIPENADKKKIFHDVYFA